MRKLPSRVVTIMRFPFESAEAYQTWREAKLANYPTYLEEFFVPIQNPYQVTEQECYRLQNLCCKTNMAIYQFTSDVEQKSALLAFGKQLGLQHIDRTLSCEDDDGVSNIQVAETGYAQEYIPYTDRALHWHTDGYYNSLDEQVHAILLHCVRPAAKGGFNQLVDHEIAYIRLRDENPEFITALMGETVMTIPENVQNGEVLRPERTGPVFSTHLNRLHMRYTERQRHILWEQSSLVQDAIACLTDFLHASSPYILSHTLEPGQGLLCNNILHNRSGFTEGNTEQQRLLYRIRYHDRVGCNKAT